MKDSNLGGRISRITQFLHAKKQIVSRDHFGSQVPGKDENDAPYPFIWDTEKEYFVGCLKHTLPNLNVSILGKC